MSQQQPFFEEGGVQDGARIYAALPGQGGSGSSSRRSTNPDGFRAPDFSAHPSLNMNHAAEVAGAARSYEHDSNNRGAAAPPSSATAPHSPADSRRGPFSANAAAHLATTTSTSAPPPPVGLLPAFNDGPLSAPPVSAPPSADHSLFSRVSSSQASSTSGAMGPPSSSDSPFVFGAGGVSAASTTSPLLTLSQMGEMGNGHPPAASAHPARLSPTQRRRVSGASARQRPQLTSIDTNPGESHQIKTEPATAFNGPAGGGQGGSPYALNQIGALLDQVVNLASSARDLYHSGNHGPSSMCLQELSRNLNMIGDLGSQSVNRMDRDPQAANHSTGALNGAVPVQATSSGSGSSHQRTHSETTNTTNALSMISLPPESPGIRKRAMNPKEEVPMKTMRGHQGVPIDAPAPPPSAPPATSENVQAPRFEPPRSAPPPLTHTNSAPLVPQLKNLGPSPLGPGQIQSQGWHDPGAATAGNNRVGDGLSMPSGGVGNATSPVIQQSLSGFNSTSASSASLSSAAFASMPTQSLPASPRALPTHSRTRSILDGAFDGLESHTGSPVISQPGAGFDDDDDSHNWPADSGAASPRDAWSPSQDFDENFFGFAQAQSAYEASKAAEGAEVKDGSEQPAHVMSLKGTVDVPDMPGRGPIPTLPHDLQEKLDALFYQYLRWVCSTNDCTDANGEGIHQTLMPKRMSRLNHSEDFRPFKFRIQAFVNRWQEEVYKNGISEEQCSHKRLRQYLWTQPYISRFNEDGRKAKSKGNHVWIVEGRKLSDEEWEFQRFERKIVGPQEKVAHRGVLWTWTLRVWDPQMSAASIKPTFSVKSKPAWLTFNNDDDAAAEKTLSGTPNESSSGGLVTVCAQCLRGNGSLQNLEISFDLGVAPGDNDKGGEMMPPPQQPSSSHQRQMSGAMQSGLGLGMPLMEQHHHQNSAPPMHMTADPSVFAPTMAPGSMPSHGAATLSSMGTMMGHTAPQQQQQHTSMPPMPSSHQGLMAPPAPPSQHQQQQQQQLDDSQFFASMGYPFTPPAALTSQPPPFFTDHNGDSPMLPIQHQHAPTAQPLGGGMDNGANLNNMQQFLQQQPQGNTSNGLVMPAVTQGTPASAAPVPPQSLEPHDQVQRLQVRAIIERMQADQTANLSLKLPTERRNSKASLAEDVAAAMGGGGAGSGSSDGGQMQQAQAQHQAQMEQQQRVQQAHMELQQQQQAQAHAQAVPMPPPGQPLQLSMLTGGSAGSGGGNPSGLGVGDGNGEQGPQQSSAAATPFGTLSPHTGLNEAVFGGAGHLLRPAGGDGSEINPFSEISFAQPHMPQQ